MKAIYIVCVIALLGAMMVAPAAATDWSAFQKDNHNTGLTSDKAPITNPYGNGISWERSFAANFDEAPVVVGDTVYVVGADNKVRAMNKTTGALKWETSTSGGGFLLGNMGAGNGTIFVPTVDGKIFGINDTTGVVEWSATESGQMNTPVVYDDHKIYFGDWGGNGAYYCYSDTGTEIWQRTSESGSGYYWAGAATIGDYLVYGDDAGHLTSVYKANGTTVHEIDVSTEFGVTANEIRSSICYVEDLDRIYFTSKGGYIYALGMNNDGTFDTTDKHHAYIGYSTSTPAVYNNKVYVGAGGMYGGGSGISCLDADLTDEDWHFAAAAGSVQSSPAITTAYDDGDGEVYIYVTTNTAAGKVYCVNESGVEQWSWGESGKTDWTLCGVAISDGWIFYGTDSKYVFGFATTESLLGSTPTSVTPFLVSGNITYGTGNPVTNPIVTVTNLATSKDFTVKTDASSNYYLTLTDSTHIIAGDTIRIIASDGSASSETDHPVTASDLETGGFVQDMAIESGDLPDLTVTEKYEDWISLVDGTYNVTCTVANIGTSGADASTTAIEIDGTVVVTDPVPALAIGESHTSTLGPFTMLGENDTIRVCADSDEIINELNETNNSLENVFEAPSMPDLIVWVALKTPGYVDEDNLLGVRVKNTGTEDAGSFSVSLAIDGTQVPEQTVPLLAAGETTELEYAWMPTELGGHLLSATVDTNNDVSESNETNNDFARTSVIIKRTDWHQFHYDIVHTGFSPCSAPDTNETLWISDEISAIGGTSTVVADGKVFAYGGPTGWSGGAGALYCLDEFTGAILWNISIPAPAYGSWSSPAYHDGKVFTSTDIEAGCYDAATGEQIWAFENPTNGPSVNGGPVVADGKVIVNDWQAGHYYCLDEETGELLWTFTEEQTGDWNVGYTQGVPAYEDGKFYLTTWLYVGGNVYCVDADTGDVIWNQTTPLDTCGSPAVVDGTVYVTNYDFYGDGAIYAMDAGNGDILWNYTIQRSDSTPAVAYGNVYVTGGAKGYSDVQTYCFNTTTGDLVWETDTADAIGAWTCSVAVADGKVFVGTEGGDSFDYAGTYALDAFTGDVIWSYPQGGSSPAVADDIVFTIGGGRVYAFYSEPPDLTVAAIETPANLRNGVTNPISATITNVGGTDAKNFDVSLDVGVTQVDTATIATLAPGENATVEFLWTPDATGGATLTVTADAGDSVEELVETNNDLSETVDVLPKLTVTANVRIEGKNETVWCGDVTFSNSTIAASDGSVHYLNEPTALGALDCANKSGGFGYVVESDPTYGLYISEINNEPPIGWDGWMYRVNYVSPWVGAADYTLADNDEVLWYFGAWTAPPLAIELSTTKVNISEEFVATVTAYNGTSIEFEPVDGAEVYIDGELYGLTEYGMLTISIDTAGSYQIHTDKGTWADYTRSEKTAVAVLPVETSFIITGHVSDSDGSPCNGTWVQITNLNTSVSWDAENDSASNYYNLVLDSDNVSVGNALLFEASGCTETKTVEHTVTQSEIDSGGFSEDITLEAAAEVDNTTTVDMPVSGVVLGIHEDMHESDDVYESITEVLSTGNPAKRRYSHLEHKWTIDVIDGSKANVTFYLEACHSPSSDGDDFVFAYSTDDGTYTDMVTVIKIDDNNAYQTYELPNDLSGTVYIRVKDTDQTAGNQGFDTIHIDQMFIRSVLAQPSYGVTVTIDEASQTVAPGEGTTYTVRVKNTGDLDASYSVAMSGTAVTEATIGVSPLNWNTGTLLPNAEDVRIVTVSTNSSTLETTYTLTATAICDQDAGVTDSATSDLVVSSVTNAMHIAGIDMSFKTAGPNTNAIALVTIVDAAGAPVGDATVEGHWSGATTDTDSGLTDGASGEVALESDKVRNPPSGTVFTFTVDDVSLAGWAYDQAANVETSDSITV